MQSSFAIVIQQSQLRTRIRPITNRYYCTAVWPQLNKIVRTQFNRPISKTVYQCSGRDLPTQLHSRKQSTIKRYRASDSHGSQATGPAGLQDTHNHHHQVACSKSIAVSTMRRHEGRSVARRNAECSPRLSGLRSLSIVRNQD